MTPTQPPTKEQTMSAQPTPLTRELHITVETITPDQAAIYLSHVRNPRRLRPAKATVFAADMAAGNWHLGSSSIKFDTAGALRDGEHRLAACVESNSPFPTVIYWNVTDEAIDNTDRGMARQWADVLAGRGVANTRQVQAIVNLSWRWDRGELLAASWNRRMTPTVSESEDYLEAHPAVLSVVTVTHRITQTVGGKASVVGSFLLRAGTIDLDASDRFAEGLHTGANLATDDPLRRLRDRIMTDRAYIRKSARDQQSIDLAIMAKAWNHWMRGTTLKQLSWRPSAGEAFPDLIDAEGCVYPFPDVVARSLAG
jgi:hypothetical protein